jgi:hypothetical protein
MKLSDLEFTPTFELLAPQALFRIQRTRANKQTVRIGSILLPPMDLMAGRFDLDGTPVGYFAQAPETAILETLFRREATGVSLETLTKRRLLCVQTTGKLALLDLRPHASTWPVLQSLRLTHTQELALDACLAGYVGIVYRSAQQAGMDCYALFGDAVKTLKPAWSELLAERGTGNLHSAVASVLSRSKVPLVP